MPDNAPFDGRKAVVCCRLAIMLCSAEDNILTEALQTALKQGLTADEIREIILTSYLFDGYPTAVEGFRLIDKLAPSSSTDDGACFYSPENVAQWRQRGAALCQLIYGRQYETLMNRVQSFAPELKDAMLVEGYGKVLARPKLDIRLRELCVVAILAFKNRPRQLLSHLLGALRLKVPPQSIMQAILSQNEILPPHSIILFERVIDRALENYDMS